MNSYVPIKVLWHYVFCNDMLYDNINGKGGKYTKIIVETTNEPKLFRITGKGRNRLWKMLFNAC